MVMTSTFLPEIFQEIIFVNCQDSFYDYILFLKIYKLKVAGIHNMLKKTTTTFPLTSRGQADTQQKLLKLE